MVKEIKAYQCEECGKKYANKEGAENCDHKKKAKTKGDPVVELY